ncbi:hypothetical protein [Bradyrhizobium sp. Cp5.3]|uniref:hypothetical protein n=1 Tax=Bradyrhizobium sp. Cp5.3 TaxID=443598 RepID=UPI0012EC2D45|nr:hypothetical protein [Bradyrhizobium sp. Cp5.3]
MNGPDAAGPSPFEASAALLHLRVTVIELSTRLLPPRPCKRSEAIQSFAGERFWIASLRNDVEAPSSHVTAFTT